MQTSTKLMLGLSFLLAALVPPAHAGTQADPEYTDPAGDVPYLLSPGTNADWADIVGAWFEPIPGGVRVNVEALRDASAADEDVVFYVNWDVLGGQAEHCYSELAIYVTEGDEFSFNTTDADLSYVCQGEEQPFTIPIVDVTLQLGGLWNGGPLAVTTAGNVTSVDVPFSAFSEGKIPSLYVNGTGLQITSVSSQILIDHWFLLGDHKDTCSPSFTPPLGFEAGCPDDARIYTIGS